MVQLVSVYLYTNLNPTFLAAQPNYVPTRNQNTPLGIPAPSLEYVLDWSSRSFSFITTFDTTDI